MAAIENKSNSDFISRHKLSANITKYYLFKVAWMFMLIYTINVIFFQINNISIFRITVLDVIWAIAALLTEVPTGALADRWSRKYMLVLSSVFASIGFLIFSISSTFFPFVIATFFMAIRFSFSSGTANALIYDSLKEIGKESKYEKILGRSNLLETISILIAGVIGSYLAKYNIRIPFVLSIISSAIAAVIALTFKEPCIHTSVAEANIFIHIKKTGKYVLKHPL